MVFFYVVQSDQGRHFVSEVILQLTLAIGTTQIFSSAYKPQINGLVENYNKTLINMLSNYVQEQPSKWSQYIDFVTFSYNTSVHSTTGYKPAYLFLAFEPKLPSDTLIVLPNTDKNILQQIKIIENVRKTVPNIIRKEQLRQKM